MILLIGASKQKMRFEHFRSSKFVDHIFRHFIYNEDLSLHLKGMNMI